MDEGSEAGVLATCGVLLIPAGVLSSLKGRRCDDCDIRPLCASIPMRPDLNACSPNLLCEP